MTAHPTRRQAGLLLGLGSLVAVATACSRDAGGDVPPETGPSSEDSTPTGGRSADSTTLTVYKDPSCGCCGGWISHAEEAGISVEVVHPDDLSAVFAEHEIAAPHQSCHLSLTEAGDVFVGHIPAPFVQAYLADPPAGARGLTVPAMPIGSPGMEQGSQFEPYEVLQLGEGASTTVYAKVTSPSDQEA